MTRTNHQQQQHQEPALSTRKAMGVEGQSYSVEGFEPVTRKQAETLIYRHTHRDYRGITDGVKTILTNDPKNGGTVLCPVSALSDEQIETALPYALKKEAQRTNR